VVVRIVPEILYIKMLQDEQGTTGNDNGGEVED